MGLKDLKKETRADLVLFSVAIIWGMGFIAQKIGAGLLGPWQYNGLRFLLGALTIGFLFREKALVLRSRTLRSRGIWLGSIALLGAYFQQLGMAHTSATHAAFLTCTYVVFVPLFSSLLGKHVPRLIWISALLGLAGAFLLSVKSDLVISVGDVWVLLSALLWGVAFLVIEKAVAAEDPVGVAFVSFSVVGVVSLMVGMVAEPVSFSAVGDAWWAIVFGGVVSVGVGYTAHLVAQKYTPPTHAAIICSLESVFASIFGALILSEKLDLRGAVGAFLILGAAALTQLRGARVAA